MTVNTTNITGFIVLPDDTVREKSSVIFTMTGFDTDADDNATVVPIPREATIASDGSIDIDLWPNPEGVRSTFYRVTFSIYNGNKPHLVDGGLIEVPVSGGPYDLNDLLPIAPPQGATVDEYIAQLAAAVASAEAAADTAVAASAPAQELVDNIRLTRDDFSELASVTSSQIAVGEYAYIVRVGQWYERAADAATDDHLDYSVSGGVKWYVVPRDGRWSASAFDAVADGVTDDAAKIDLMDVAGRVVDLEGATYEYGGTFMPSATFINGNVVDDNITQTFGFQRKGQVTGNDVASLGHLGHDDGRGGNTASAWKNTLTTVRGTMAAPDSDTLYAHTANYTELHTDAVLTAPQSVWGNSYKIGAVVAEAIAGAGMSAELNGGIFRAYSTEEATGPDEFRRTLVGISAIGQTNTGAGTTSYDVWGANIIAAHTSGNAATNVVGIEVDVLNSTSAAGPLPGDPGATNFTGFWAQSDAAAGCQSDTAFLATNTSTGDGWRQILQAKGKINNWAVYLETTVNASDARGIYAKTVFASSAGRVMELWTASNEQFRVDGDSDNAVHARLGGALKKLELGAADSGGAGYKMVRVAN